MFLLLVISGKGKKMKQKKSYEVSEEKVEILDREASEGLIEIVIF